MNNLKKLRLRKKLSLREVADKTGIYYSHLWKLENGKRNLMQKHIDVLSKFYNVSSDYLLDYNGELLENTVPFSKFKRIPVINIVHAGSLDDWEIENYIIGWEYADVGNSQDYIFYAVSGDSMEPTILDGDFVLVRFQPNAENGEIVVAGYRGNTAGVKRLKRKNNETYLYSDNNMYAPIKISGDEDAFIIGKVVRIVRKL